MKFKAYDNWEKKEIKNLLTIKIDRVTGEPWLLVYTAKKMSPYTEIKESDKVYCNYFSLEVIHES